MTVQEGDVVKVQGLRGVFTVRRVEWAPFTAHLWGGPPGREMFRALPVERLRPAKQTRERKP